MLRYIQLLYDSEAHIQNSFYDKDAQCGGFDGRKAEPVNGRRRCNRSIERLNTVYIVQGNTVV